MTDAEFKAMPRMVEGVDTCMKCRQPWSPGLKIRETEAYQ
jgi:hypothetical protein